MSKKDPFQIPKALVDSLKRGEGVAFVGAGLSMAAGLPGWSGLLRRMLDWSEDQGLPVDDRPALETHVEKGDLLLVAEELREHLGKERLHKFLLEVFHESDPQPTKTHETLISLPFTAGLTSNYDTLLESAYTLAHDGKSPYCFTQDDVPELATAMRQGFYILKVHGTIHRAETIVLGLRDYRKAIHANPAYREHLRSVFSGKTVLFLGFGLNDPDLRVLLDELDTVFKGHQGRHYALLNEQTFSPIELRSFERDDGIQPILYKPSSPKHPEVSLFLEALNEQVQSLKTRRRRPRRADEGDVRTSYRAGRKKHRIIRLAIEHLSDLPEEDAAQLLRIYRSADSATLALAYLTRDPDSSTHETALRTLTADILPAGLDGPLSRLFSRDFEMVQETIREIVAAGVRDLAIVLAAMVLDPNTKPRIQTTATDALASFGTAAIEPILLLIGLCEPLRAELLVKIIAPLDEAVRPVLEAALRSPTIDLRKGAALVAEHFPSEALISPLQRAKTDLSSRWPEPRTPRCPGS